MKSGFSLTHTKRVRFGARAFVTTAVAVSFVGIAGVPAFAEPGVTSSDTTEANVAVSSAISLTGLTEDFTLTGVPGAMITGAAAVTMNVATNNLAGYAVTVLAADDELIATADDNSDAIPIGALSVRETAVGNLGAFTPVSNVTPVLTHTQDARSAPGGDTISNDFRVTIPFVNEDTYTATLNYVATTL